ncbi:MAG: MBL fold metallo-hydrolase [Candidatus Nanohalobium sp.]
MRSLNGFDIYWEDFSVNVVDEGFTVAVDPCEGLEFEADIILLTGEDCYSEEGVASVSGNGSVLVAPEKFSEKDLPVEDTEFIGEDEVLDIFGVKVEGLSCNGFCYRFVMRDTSFFVSGSVDFSEELSKWENLVDVAFLPVNGINLSVREGVKSAVRLKPECVLPYGFKDFKDRKADLKGLKAELEDRNVEVVLQRPGE